MTCCKLCLTGVGSLNIVEKCKLDPDVILNLNIEFDLLNCYYLNYAPPYVNFWI